MRFLLIDDRFYGIMTSKVVRKPCIDGYTAVLSFSDSYARIFRPLFCTDFFGKGLKVFMRILGIDPGYAIVGYGIIEYLGNTSKPIAFSAVFTEADIDFAERLRIIYDEIDMVIKKYRPEAISIEKLYFQNNATTAIKVAEARGVILLAAQMNNVPIFEYTPLQVKSAVVGYGKAEKKQVMEMTRLLLSLPEVPKPDDTADALAIAICHAHTSSSRLSRYQRNGR